MKNPPAIEPNVPTNPVVKPALNCVFCGAVKNCGSFLNNVFQNIERLGALFDNYVIIVYYDKSNDNSLQILNDYRKRNPRLIYYNNLKEVSRFRTHRLAHARNECIKVIYDKFKDFAYFAMMDFDDVCSQPVKIDALRKYLHKDTWDSLSFNKNPYYDIWALSIHPYVVSHRHLESNPVETVKNYISTTLKDFKGLVPCLSAFNGFAIYRTSKFVGCHYDGRLRLDLLPMNYVKSTLDTTQNKISLKNPGTECSKIEDCEHRSFHIMAINNNGARIRIAPEILF